MERLHQPGDLISQQYRIIDTLGQGGVGITYEAELQNGERVALKALSLRRMADWKMMELFEREAHILAQLNHHAIPRYLDYFQVDTPQNRCFYIAQQLAPGKSLAVLVESGWHPDEVEVQHLAIQVLEILIYLHSLTPPVIHRDVKPQNIIRQTNGEVFLVDFGAVADTYHNTVTGGSTVVGTYGYMAPEQFRGQAVPATDLYGLGTTLLFLLTGKSPADLPQQQLKINFRPYVDISQNFANWLEMMLQPVSEERFDSANVALAVLRGEVALNSNFKQRLCRPKHSFINLIKTEESLVVEIPAGQIRSNQSLLFTFIFLVGNGFLFLKLAQILKDLFLYFPYMLLYLSTLLANFHSSVLLVYLFLFIFFLIYLPVGWQMLKVFIFSPILRTQLKIDEKKVRLRQWLLGWCFHSEWYYLERKHRAPTIVNELIKELGTCKFCSFLTQQEQQWLKEEIKAFLAQRY